MKEYTFAVPDNGDVDKGWAILSVCWAFVLCALVSTALRVWVRIKLTRNIGWDDHIMTLAMVRFPRSRMFMIIQNALVISLRPKS